MFFFSLPYHLPQVWSICSVYIDWFWKCSPALFSIQPCILVPYSPGVAASLSPKPHPCPVTVPQAPALGCLCLLEVWWCCGTPSTQMLFLALCRWEHTGSSWVWEQFRELLVFSSHSWPWEDLMILNLSPESAALWRAIFILRVLCVEPWPRRPLLQVQWGTWARPAVCSEHHNIYQQDVQVMVAALMLSEGWERWGCVFCGWMYRLKSDFILLYSYNGGSSSSKHTPELSILLMCKAKWGGFLKALTQSLPICKSLFLRQDTYGIWQNC